MIPKLMVNAASGNISVMWGLRGPNCAVATATVDAPPPVDTGKKWYVVKVQSGREESIRAAIERKIKIEGLEESFGQIAVSPRAEVPRARITGGGAGARVAPPAEHARSPV